MEKAGSFRHSRERAAALKAEFWMRSFCQEQSNRQHSVRLEEERAAGKKHWHIYLEKATFHIRLVPEMHHWQISHLGVIIPLADAYYQSRHPEKICANEKLMTLTAYRMKKNMKWIAQKGMLCPANFI